jgi:hypothetical protein
LSGSEPLNKTLADAPLFLLTIYHTGSYTCASSFKPVIPSAGSNATEYAWGAKARPLVGHPLEAFTVTLREISSEKAETDRMETPLDLIAPQNDEIPRA